MSGKTLRHELTIAARHARKMSTEQHRPDCRLIVRGDKIHPHPDCGGCVTDADHVWWARIADEHDAHLARYAEPDALFDGSGRDLA